MTVKVELFIESTTADDVFILDDATKGKLDDATYLLGGGPGAFGYPTDISDQVHAVSTSRGRSRLLDTIQTGTCQVRLRNHDREFDPPFDGVATSTYGPIRPGKRVRISDHAVHALNLPGASGDYASTPDAAALDITGDICIVARAVIDWTQGSSTSLVTKWDAGVHRSYLFQLLASGKLELFWTENGFTSFSEESSAVVPFPTSFIDSEVADGWVAATFDVSGYTIRFWTSTDGVSWTQLGTDQTGTATSIHSGTSPVEIGTYNAGTGNRLTGDVQAARIYDGIGDNTAPGLGTLVADFNPADFTLGGTTATDSTGKVWTVNGNAAIVLAVDDLQPRIFDGIVEDWNHEWQADKRVSASLSAVDALGQLSRRTAQIDWTATADQQAGERIADVLDWPGVRWPVGDHDLDTGVNRLQSDAVDAATSAIGYLQLVAETDRGRLFAAVDGTVTFRDRHAPITAAVSAAFGTGGIGVSGIEIMYGSEELFTQVSTERAGGVAQTVTSDETVLTEFGLRILNLSGVLLVDDVRSRELAAHLLAAYEEPEPNVSALTVILDRLSSADRATVVGLEIGDIITLDWTPTGTGTAVSQELIVEGVSFSATVDGVSVVRIDSTQITSRKRFILDDSTYGVLDDDILAF